MLRAAICHLREQLRRRGELIPVGLTWASLIAVDAALLLGGTIGTLQRPAADLPVSLTAFAIALSPTVAFFVFNMKMTPGPLWATWTASTALTLFVTSTPIRADFAPALLVLMVLVVATLASVVGGLLAAASAAALLLTAAALHRLDAIVLYLGFIVVAWLLGYLMRTQRLLVAEQIEAQQMLAEHAAADERRRIAREVHDVIAHSLSITLLHVTGARRALQQDRDVDDAVEALEQAERLGRQAMADIRRTVGLLDNWPTKAAPTTPNPASTTSRPWSTASAAPAWPSRCASRDPPITSRRRWGWRCTASRRSRWPTSPSMRPSRKPVWCLIFPRRRRGWR